MSEIDRRRLGSAVTAEFPHALAIYLFGSAATGEMTDASDIDLAVLQDAPLTPEAVLSLKARLSMAFRRDVDVVDLRRCDSVTAAQIIATGVVLAQTDARRVAEFETYAYSRYALLNEERRDIIAEIAATGRVHG